MVQKIYLRKLNVMQVMFMICVLSELMWARGRVPIDDGHDSRFENQGEVSNQEISDIRVLKVGSMIETLTLSKDRVSAWETSKISEGSVWILKHDWKGAPHLWYGLGNRMFAVITSSAGAQLYKMGAWETPLLTNSQGLPVDIDSIWNITARGKGQEACGVAIKYKGGLEDGSAKLAWKLFFTKNGTDWSPLVAPSLPTVVWDFVRLGPGEIGVAGLDENGQIEWHFYELDDNAEWKNMKIPDLPARIHTAMIFDSPRGLGVQSTAAQDQDGAAWYWFYRNVQGQWVEIHQVIPDAPLKIRKVKAYGNQHILAIQEDGPLPAGRPGFEWHYFYHNDDGSWVTVQKAIPQIPSKLYALKTFAGKRGIAYQAFLDFDTGKRTLDWAANYRLDSGKWVAVQKLLQGSPSKIWDIASFAQDRGIGIQDFSSSNKDHAPYKWTWFARKGSSWLPVARLIPTSPRGMWLVDSSELDDGISIQADGDQAVGEILFPWYWFLPEPAGRWVEVGKLLKPGENTVDRSSRWSVSLPESTEENWHRGVLAIRSSDNRTLWFLRDDRGKWISIGNLMK